MLSQHRISPLSPDAIAAARAAVDIKTKPPGSLGRIEDLAVTLSAAQGTLKPTADPARLFLYAGDHGLTEEGVSAWPSEVTAQMVMNFLAGGAAANVFSRTNGIDITIVDAGVKAPLPDNPALVRAGIRNGTRNALKEDALTADETIAALEFGARLAAEAVEAGTRTVLIGEMGIGNTSSATLLGHAIAGLDIDTLTGPGAGLDQDGVSRKAEILKKTASRKPGRLSALDALAAFGGLEIAAMAGTIIGAASRGGVVLVDGFIASAAALCALSARPEAAEYTIFSHRSKEPGHRLMMEAIGADPLIDLNLRLGEGSGALLAFPLLRNACSMLCDMATFESAGVSGKDDA
jgi:nicotinate-nucleotide--dimethylbenzimidazole phosphoribosyltransferase